MFRKSAEQLERYTRNILLAELGEEGQAKLGRGKVLIVGTGGLGSPAAYYLAASGVGNIGLVDDDIVSLSNLQRQILHSTKDLGRPKVDSAAEKLERLNPDINIISYKSRLTGDNVAAIIRDYDVIVDATDNFDTRSVVSRACFEQGRPFIHGAVLRFNGHVTTFIPGRGPCYSCIFGNTPVPGAYPTAAEAGILGAVPGVIGVIQATEAVKYIAAIGDLLVGRLLNYDALAMTFYEVNIKQADDCPICGEKNKSQPQNG